MAEIVDDADLFGLLRQVLAAGLAMRGLDYPIIQRSQGTQQGIPTDPTVFFQKMYDTRYGMPGTYTQHNMPEKGKNTETMKQNMETTIQISVLLIRTPTMDAKSQPTGSDVSNYLASIMQRRDTVRKLMDSNVNVLRVRKVDNAYFEDDRHRHEAWPVFEVVLTWESITTYVVDATTTVTGNIYRTD